MLYLVTIKKYRFSFKNTEWIRFVPNSVERPTDTGINELAFFALNRKTRTENILNRNLHRRFIMGSTGIFYGKIKNHRSCIYKSRRGKMCDFTRFLYLSVDIKNNQRTYAWNRSNVAFG